MSPASGPIYYWTFNYVTTQINVLNIVIPLFGSVGKPSPSRPVEYLRIAALLDNPGPVTIGGPNVQLRGNGLDQLSPGETLVIESEIEGADGGVELIDAAQFYGIASIITSTLLVTVGTRDQRSS